jgi:hypothetical protein
MLYKNGHTIEPQQQQQQQHARSEKIIKKGPGWSLVATAQVFG